MILFSQGQIEACRGIGVADVLLEGDDVSVR